MRRISLFTAFFTFCGSPVVAETIGWDFTDDDAIHDSGTPANFTVLAISIGNTNGTVSDPVNGTSASSGYTGASGTGNIGNAVKIGALDTATSSYIEVTFTPAATFGIQVTDFDYGTRSTGTGPQAHTLRSSADGYVADLMTVAVANNSAWSFKDNTVVTTTGAIDAPLTLRLYTHSGAGNPTAGTINSRLDDISIVVSAVNGTPTPPLTVSIDPTSVDEGAGVAAATLTVTRPAPFTGALVVSVGGNDASEAVPSAATVTIPDTQASAALTLNAVDDAILDGPQSVTFTCAATGFTSGTAQLTVTDNEVPLPPVTDLFINEIDSDQPGTDTTEFIELYTPEGARGLGGLVLVLFNGNGDISYQTLDLSAYATDAGGFFLIGPAGMTPAPDFVAPAATSWLQNGPDAVAIYRAAPATFPNGTAPATTGMLDALVYDATSNTIDDGLVTALGQSSQIKEDIPEEGTSALARRGDGRCAWMNQAPTPKATNGPDITYAVWEAMHPGIGAATDDPDADRLTNSGEFFFGGGPLTAEAFPAAPAVTAGPDPRHGFTFRKRACPSSQVAYTLQSSTDLAAWTTIPHTETARTINSDGTETVTWVETTAAPGSRRFLHIRGAQAP